MANFDAYGDVLQDLKDRTDWETRQSQWYRMRHMGLRRRNKPYPGAADMHFPLVDSLIERLKAFYFQQLYATETLISFISLKQQDESMTSSVGRWTDFRLKQKSNFERVMLSAIDHMLLSGFCPAKLLWNDDKKKLAFSAVNPIHLIVPKYTIDFKDAPRAVHVLHMSVADYKRNSEFDQDKELIKLIKGRGDANSSGQSNQLLQDKLAREGLTIGQTDEDIVLWEIYSRESDGVRVETFSPLQPDSTKEIRKSFLLPYDQGEFKGKDRFPFFMLQMEIKDEGWYSPRGIAEINAAFETSLCKMWNQKHDWMDYFNRPTFSSERGNDLGNISNIRQMPGQILPPGLTPNQAPTPPMSFDEEMQSTRALAEYRTNVPDLGASSHFGQKPGYGGEKPTARQIDAIVGQSGIADDMRVRVFRLGLAEAYRMAWSIYLQYDKTSLNYVVGNDVQNLDSKALHDEYLITPNGSADSWNKGLQLQKAGQRLQMWKDNPYIGQDELVKSVLELDEAYLVKRLFRDPGIQQQEQGEQQDLETVLMLHNFGAVVHPSDDDKAHLSSLSQFGQGRMKEGNPITPIQAQLFGAHIQGHLQALQKKKDKAFGQFRTMMNPFLQILSQLAQAPPQPQNVVPMVPGQGSPVSPSGPVSGQGKPPDPQGNAAKLMAGLLNLAKAGAAVGPEQFNAVLGEAGIPPIMLAPPQVPGVASVP